MKKISIILLLIISLCFLGCNKGQNDSDGNDIENTSSDRNVDPEPNIDPEPSTDPKPKTYFQLEQLFDINEVVEIYYKKGRKDNQMLISNDESFFSDLFDIFDVQYVDYIEYQSEYQNINDDLINVYWFILYLNNDNITDIHIQFSKSGYIIINIREVDEDNMVYLKGSYVSASVNNYDELVEWLLSEKMNKYDIKQSAVAFYSHQFGFNQSHNDHLRMYTSIDGISYECMVDYGTIKDKEKTSYTYQYGEMIEWFPEKLSIDSPIVTINEYVNVLLKKDDKIIGYVIVQIKRYNISFFARIIETSILESGSYEYDEVMKIINSVENNDK